MAETCVSLIPGVTELVAHKGYDTDAFRSFLKERSIKTVIPGKSNPKKRIRPQGRRSERRVDRRAWLLPLLTGCLIPSFAPRCPRARRAWISRHLLN